MINAPEVVVVSRVAVQVTARASPAVRRIWGRKGKAVPRYWPRWKSIRGAGRRQADAQVIQHWAAQGLQRPRRLQAGAGCPSGPNAEGQLGLYACSPLARWRGTGSPDATPRDDEAAA